VEGDFGELIFTYDNYRRYLKDYFAQQKTVKKNFSFRYFAQIAGFKSHSFCDRVLRGDRNLTHESVVKIAKAMKLPKLAVEYFQYLVQYNQARSYQEKMDHFQELARLRKKLDFYRIQEEQYAYLSSWHYQVLREVAVYGEWKGNYKTLGSLLMPPISEKEAEEGVKLLIKTGFLKKAAAGRLIQADPVVTGEGCPPHIVKNIRTQFLLKAIEAGEMLPKSRRHLSYATLAISEKHYAEISAMLDEVRKKILSSAIEDASIENIYSLNIQLYPLARTRAERPLLKGGEE
jgi:uncharacterized protein (TIGR02147 family)